MKPPTSKNEASRSGFTPWGGTYTTGTSRPGDSSSAAESEGRPGRLTVVREGRHRPLVTADAPGTRGRVQPAPARAVDCGSPTRLASTGRATTSSVHDRRIGLRTWEPHPTGTSVLGGRGSTAVPGTTSESDARASQGASNGI